MLLFGWPGTEAPATDWRMIPNLGLRPADPSISESHRPVDSTVEKPGPTCAQLMNIWDQILNYLQLKLSREAFENWLTSTSFLGLENGVLYVLVPDRETSSWLEAELATPVAEALRDLRL